MHTREDNLRVYPNLANELEITRLNQVWASVQQEMHRIESGQKPSHRTGVKGRIQQKEAAFCHRVPLSRRLQEGKREGNGEGG